MKTHHRNIAFRPPAKRYERGEGGRKLILRFFRTYVWPHKWPVLACMTMVGLSACTVYLMAFYGRVVVDSILVVTPETQQVEAAAGDGRSTWTVTRERLGERDRGRQAANRLPTRGLGRRIDRGDPISFRPPGAGRRLLIVFLCYVTTLVSLNMLTRLAQRTRIRVGRKIVGQLREDLHEKVLELSVGFHRVYTPGRLMSRIISDVEVVQQQMMMALMQLSQTIVMITVGVIILLCANWRMCLFIAAITPIYGILYRRARTGIRAVNRELRHTNSCLFGFVTQKLDGIKAVQAYGREGLERLSFHRLVACFLRDALHQQRLSAGVGRSSQIISSVATGSIFIYGSTLVLNGSMTLGEMLFTYSAAASLFMPVLQLAQLNVMLANLTVVLNRVSELLDKPLEIVDAPDAVDFPAPLQRGISLNNVTFAYDPSDTDTVPPIRNLSLHIPAGSWMCVMGASGCGKTTLLYLLSRLYEPTSGSILVDGVPLAKIRMESLRRTIGFVPQEAQIFSGTVRDNICYGLPDASPKEIMAAAKAAELHDFILEMPVQYETTIGEKGTTLSGGQRQRLSLARALITNPDILVLDDCTSALDADTEQRIQNTLAHTLQGKTAIIVSQRVSMAKRCDRICVIDDGTISEIGSHAELVASGGFYATLHAQQTEQSDE